MMAPKMRVQSLRQKWRHRVGDQEQVNTAMMACGDASQIMKHGSSIITRMCCRAIGDLWSWIEGEDHVRGVIAGAHDRSPFAESLGASEVVGVGPTCHDLAHARAKQREDDNHLRRVEAVKPFVWGSDHPKLALNTDS